MEKKTVEFMLDKPVEITVSSGNSLEIGLTDHTYPVLDKFLLSIRESIDDWLEQYYNQGWRLRYPLDRTIFKIGEKRKSNNLFLVMTLGRFGRKKVLLIYGYNIDLVKD